MTARDEILRRIREALGLSTVAVETSYASISRDYVQTGSLSRERRLELFLDRLVDYDAEVIQIENNENIGLAIHQALAHEQETSVVAPAEFPTAWMPEGLQVQRDCDLTTAQLERFQAVLTTCEVAIASTGTIFLVHHKAQGRRVLTLLPDHHICIVHRNQIVETVPEALAAISNYATLPITSISGPSATSDIEMTRIRGVHGPRRLTVILYG